MMFKFGLKNLKHNLLMNILIILQMTVVFIIAVFMSSTIVSRFQLYTPIKDKLNSNGYFYYVSNAINPETNLALRSTDELYELLDQPKDIVATYNVWLSYGTDNINCISYDDEFIEMFTPELEEGTWFDFNKDASEYIPVVISQNPYNFNVGDIIELDNFGFGVNAEIIGILKENSKIIGFSNSENGKNDFRSTYINYNYEIEELPLFIFCQKDLIYKNITMQLNGPVFVTYSDIIDDIILESNNSTMNRMMTLSKTRLDEMKSNSLEYIFSQIYTLFPIMICILIFTLVGTISVNALSAKKQLRNYAVYYICGLKWKQCAMINFISSLISVLTSFILSMIILLVMKHLNFLGNTVVKTGVWQFLVCLILIAVYLLFSIILPLNIIGKTTPSQILKTN